MFKLWCERGIGKIINGYQKISRVRVNNCGRYEGSNYQSNLDYPDSLGPDEIVRIIEGLDNRKYEY